MLRFIVIGRLLFELFCSLCLLLVLNFSFPNLLVHVLDNEIHVLTPAYLSQDAFLELQHRLLNDPEVEVDHVCRDLGVELWILVHYRLELLLAEAVRIDMVQGFVKELTLLAEHIFVAPNNRLFAQLDMEVALLLLAESDAVLTRLLLLIGGTVGNHVNLLNDLVLLLENVLSLRVEPGFERLQHRNHKCRVLCVFPAISITFLKSSDLSRWVFHHPKVDLEHVNELGEEKFEVYVFLNVVW